MVFGGGGREAVAFAHFVPLLAIDNVEFPLEFWP